MDAACATQTATAADRNGLPAALSLLEDLHQKARKHATCFSCQPLHAWR